MKPASLLRWYPRAWRARYGEEFTELLTADLAERPRSAARTADVIRGGLVARLTEVGAATLQAQLDVQRRVADVGLRRLAQGWGLA